MREVRRGSDEQDSIWIDKAGNRRNMDFVRWGGAFDEVNFEAEIFTSFVKCRVSGVGENSSGELAS